MSSLVKVEEQEILENVEEREIEKPIDPQEEQEVQEQEELQRDVKKLITEEMKSDLQEFLDLCKSVKLAKENMKILNERKSELEVTIREFMIQNEIPAFKTPNGMISIRQTKSVKPLNKDFLRETISTKIADAQIALELSEMAFTNRPTIFVSKIKVVSKRDANK